jgi:hypothetical protein
MVFVPWTAVVGMRGARVGEATWMSEQALEDAFEEVNGHAHVFAPRQSPALAELLTPITDPGMRDAFAAARGETPRVYVPYDRPASSPRIRAQGRRTSKAPHLRIFDGGRGNDKGGSMTDYAKHIETLQQTASHDMHAREALTAAIELMRAATPKSPEDEREQVRKAVLAGPIYGVDRIVRDLAAARAEGYAQAKADLQTEYAKGHRVGYEAGSQAQLDEPCDHIRRSCEEVGCRAPIEARLVFALSAAQAEIARLRRESDATPDQFLLNQHIEQLQTVNQAFILTAKELQTKLTERDAEIERLRDERDSADRVMRHLDIKLTNLRAAAERFMVKEIDGPAMDAAIEASR